MSQPTALIIGAGYAGIALANLLGKAGYAVTVVEKNSSAGGRIAVRKQDGLLLTLDPLGISSPKHLKTTTHSLTNLRRND